MLGKNVADIVPLMQHTGIDEILYLSSRSGVSERRWDCRRKMVRPPAFGPFVKPTTHR